MCVCVCVHLRSRVCIGVCMCVCVCHHHSHVDSFLCVNVRICMLTPLNDCDYIRQYFTVNYKVLCINKRLPTACFFNPPPHIGFRLSIIFFLLLHSCFKFFLLILFFIFILFLSHLISFLCRIYIFFIGNIEIRGG